ncbi:MAG TPA: CHASE2 domain-containing protein, partial [Verrucomicrobiae bacterium]|nr:CHASE2 domain-containing protein [Verrucomicrobiae bacterium]
MKLNDVKLNSLKQPPFLIAAGVLAVVCLIQLLHSDFLERLESITYDWRVREAAHYHTTVATNLGYVDINEKSIAAVDNGSLGFQFGLYWPRQIYGRVVRELHNEGV